jgi:hypothetical protein
MNCRICNSEKTEIYISEVESFCRSCFNEKMNTLTNREVPEYLTKEISFTTYGDETISFLISYINLGHLTVFTASEVLGYREIKVILKNDEPFEVGVKRLVKKIEKAIDSKTLIKNNDLYYIMNAIFDGDTQYTLNTTGFAEILYNDDGNQLVIDGKIIAPHDFIDSLVDNEGFNLFYQVQDKSDELIGKNELLITRNFEVNDFYNRISRKVSYFLQDNSIPKKFLLPCKELICEELIHIDKCLLINEYDKYVEMLDKLIVFFTNLNVNDDFKNEILSIILRNYPSKR